MADALLAALLGGDVPALLVAGGLVRAAGPAALRALGAGAAPGAAVADLFDEASRGKLAAALADAGARRWELQLARPGAPPALAQVLVAPADRAGARLLLLLGPDAEGAARAARLGEELLATNDRLVDTTRELARRTRELEAARARLEQLVLQRDQLLAALSHDLRAPLISQRLLAERLRRRARSLSEPELGALLAMLERSAERMLGMVTNMLDSERLSEGLLRLQRSPLALAEVAADVQLALGALAEEVGVRIEVAAAEPGPVEGDRSRLFQLLSNLVDNALRHAPRGTAVVLAIDGDRTAARLAVQDAGPGVPEAQRATIFERFGPRRGAQAEAPDPRRRPGSLGLGLYIARQIAELHGGSLQVGASPLGGAAFTLTLPRPPFDSVQTNADPAREAGAEPLDGPNCICHT